MNKFFGLIILVLFLSGCEHQYSYQYLTTHPKVLEQVLSHCQEMSVSDASQNMTCIYAQNAREEVGALLNEVTANIQGFGKKIIAAQTKLAEIKGQYQKDPSSKLAADIQSQQDYIARLLAICDYVGE